MPASRKEGWKIPENLLHQFIQQRLPDSYTTNLVKKENKDHTINVANKIKEQARAEMWIELAKRNIWEGYIEVKKSLIRECIQHKRYSKDLEEKVWKSCEANSKAYKKPRINYLLEAFAFDGKRLLMDKSFEHLEEQIIFPVIEYDMVIINTTVFSYIRGDYYASENL